ncbi:MAG: hypothetical protein WA151_17540 [Desulfatirhabdiaceae bacterium]
MNIGIAHWQGRVSPVFDVSEELVVIEISDGREISRKFFRLTSQRPYPRAKEISDIGIDVLICGAVSSVFEIALVGKRIRFAAFVCGDIDAVLKSFLTDHLSQSIFHMPGSGEKRRHRKMRYSDRYRFTGLIQGRPDHPVLSTIQEVQHMPNKDGTGPMPGGGSGQGRKGDCAAGQPAGQCICPKCGHKMAHVSGQPCNQQVCPACGVPMKKDPNG